MSSPRTPVPGGEGHAAAPAAGEVPSILRGPGPAGSRRPLPLRRPGGENQRHARHLPRRRAGGAGGRITAMPCNSFGALLRVTTAGESHGPGYAVIIDGCPPGLPLSEEDLLPDLRRRRPGQSKIVTQRKEEDAPEILS